MAKYFWIRVRTRRVARGLLDPFSSPSSICLMHGDDILHTIFYPILSSAPSHP